jgi:DHA2 family multidrug resistance protein
MSEADAARRRVLLGATMLATMLYTIDSTIVNVALPHMQGGLQATQEQVAWVVTSYIVMGAIATPLAGWLGSRYGLRRVMLVSIAGFTAGSMLCGLATGLAEMVVFRMIQGAFGAALVPLSNVALLEEFPREQHGKVTGLWGMGVLVGPVIGPTLGGYLTDELNWRWAFYINLPVGLIAYAGILASLRRGHEDSSRPFDALGFVLLSLALGLFQLMLDRGQHADWFESAEIVVEAFLCGVFFWMFFVHVLTKQHPFVDPALFRDRNFLAGVTMMFAVGLSIISPTVLLPSFLQHLQGYSPTQAGDLVAVRGATSVFAMLLAGRLIGRVDVRVLMTIGVGATALSLWMMANFTIYSPARQIVMAAMVQGFGAPFTFVPLSVAAYATLPSRMRAEAGVMLTLLRNVGSSVGISLVVALLARSTQVNGAYMAEHFTAYDAARWQAVGGAPGANETTAALVGEIARQSSAIAYSNDFFVLAMLATLTLPLAWVMRTSRAPPASAPSAADTAGH